NTLRWYGTSSTGGTASTTAPTPSSSTAGQTIYYVSQFNAGSNCESPRAALTVTINPLPVTPTISAATATSFCTGGSVVLSSNATSGNQWYKDGTIITGSTNQTFTANQSGAYTVRVKNANNCESAVSNTLTVTVNTLPAVPTISAASSTSFCTGGSVVLSSSATTGNQWYKDGVIITGSTNQTYTANAAGVYTVTVSNAASCSNSSVGVTVTVNTIPAKPTITQTGADLVSSSNAGNVWHKDANAIAGATDKTYRPLTSGNYTVQVRVNGCNSPMSDNYYYLVTSVVNTNSDNSSYKLYPNPVRDKVMLDAGGIVNKISYQLFDAKGRRVMMNSFTKSTLIDMSKYSAGAYTILITNTKTLKQESKQIIKH
ncbi:MAG: T9SS type A sorting domain-containing protein, partial [Dolichospermum sp.]